MKQKARYCMMIFNDSYKSFLILLSIWEINLILEHIGETLFDQPTSLPS